MALTKLSNRHDPDLAKELEKTYHELEMIESDKAESRAAKILCGLGFDSSDQKKTTK